MTRALQKMREWRNVDSATFHGDIVTRNQPAVLKGLAGDWPAVREGLKSPQALCAYLKNFDAGRSVMTLTGEPSIKGFFFYSDDMRGLNFERKQEPFGAFIEQLLAHLNDEVPPALAIQSAPVADYLPGFARENAIGLLDASVTPRIWIGNAIKVAAHFDPQDNIACVVGGRRRFTLFPPDQISNLYIGPLEFSPAGAPVSMVHVEDPDLVRHPRFAEALAAAQVAEVEPGDAVYIPYLWWHYVESLEAFNVLLNYWWNPAIAGLGSPLDCLFHGLLAISALPPNQRDAWRALFDHYVFQTKGEPASHLAPEHRGAMGAMTPELARYLKAALQRALSRP